MSRPPRRARSPSASAATPTAASGRGARPQRVVRAELLIREGHVGARALVVNHHKRCLSRVVRAPELPEGAAELADRAAGGEGLAKRGEEVLAGVRHSPHLGYRTLLDRRGIA